MSRLSKPDSYVRREVAARVLREMADEIEAVKDERLISVAIDRRWATELEVERELARQSRRLEKL